jgi:uncharacterized oxidoreductase
MKIANNTVLITGGASGIGLSIAEEFVKNGNEVIVCGRSEDKLKEAKEKLPQIHTRVCDLSKEQERKSLFEWAISNFKNINMLVNNAGIQRMIDFKKNEFFEGEDEIEINLKAYVHLSAYFIPEFMKKESAIINISSGLGFIPLTIMPVYCATKAAIHSFTVSLRHQLKDTSVKVFEIIPPTVNTNLDKGARERRNQENRGIPPEEVAKATMDALEKDEYEVAVGMAEKLRKGARENPEEIFRNMNRW